MCEERNSKQFMRLSIESQNAKTIWDFPFSDPDVEDMCTGFFSAMIGQTWMPTSVLHGMKDFAESMLEVTESGFCSDNKASEPEEMDFDEHIAEYIAYMNVDDEKITDLLAKKFSKNPSAYRKLIDKVIIQNSVVYA